MIGRFVPLLVAVALLAVPSSEAQRYQPWEGFADWSPDGRWIFFARDILTSPRYYLIKADGTGIRHLRGVTADHSWSPDSQRIVWSSQNLLGRRPYPQIIVMNADGTGRRQLTHGRVVFTGPRWSPDGGLIAYSVSGRRTERLWVMRTDGTGKRPFTPAAFYGDAVSWSPDGRRAAFAACFPGRACRGKIGSLFVVRRDGSGLRRLADGVALSPLWSPDGRWISVQYEGSSSKLAVVRPDGTGRRIVADLGLGEACGWSPDSRRILFQRGTPLRMWTMNHDGTRPRPVLREQGRNRFRDADDHCGDWSPDGRWIAFSHGGHGSRIYVVRPDGSGLHVLYPAGNRPR